MNDLGPFSVRLRSVSASDDLGYRGQHAVSQAVDDASGYLIVGGHMVRLLQAVYPTPRAVPRSTIDADTALEDVEVVGAVTQSLVDANFTKTGGNLLIKDVGDEKYVEVNLLLARTGGKRGLDTQTVEGIGQIDTLPELSFAMSGPALLVDVEAELSKDEVITYRIRIPTVETALVLKALSWSSRRTVRDVADVLTLLEIREEHPDTAWRMNEPSLIGFRKDAARALHELAGHVNRKIARVEIPAALDQRRFAALITAHVTQPAR